MDNITFMQFMLSYSFLTTNDLPIDSQGRGNEDTEIIRIYFGDVYEESTDYKTPEWFEFGINQFYGNAYMEEMLKKIFSKEILESYVYSIEYHQDRDIVLCIFLTKEKHRYID